MYSEEHLRPWLDALTAALPGLDLFDGHVHVGIRDPAGLQATADEVIGSLQVAGARAVVFPLSEPTGYREANRTMLDLAERHPDRLVAFARLDPADDAGGEARRWADRGARGFKLHPRGEDFRLDDERLDAVFGLADERHLPVLVHAGAGTPEVGHDAVRRAQAHPGARVVLAHGAIGSFEDVVPTLDDIPNLFLDTSWWNPSDLWAVFRMVPPGQIVHGSDVPFNSPTQGAITSGRLALQAGLSADQVRAVLGGTLQRLVDATDLPEPGERPGDVAALDPEAERVYVTLCSAVVPMLAGDPPGEGLELAKATVRSPSGRHEALMGSIATLLEIAEGETDKDPLRPLRTPGFDAVLTAAVVARTPDVPLPAAPSPTRPLADEPVDDED
jgi:predicted TIM-barrel fold metal-dependent hydrolase